MKSPLALVERIEQRLSRTWHSDIVGLTSSWPHDVPVGKLASADIAERFALVQRDVSALQVWAHEHGLAVRTAARHVGGTRQQVPTHVTVPDIATAAAVCGEPWTLRVERGRRRAAALDEAHPGSDATALVLRAFDRYGDTDFELLLTASKWFAANHAEGLTPRQVPIPGLHAKWLNTNRQHVEALAGRPLNLAGRHPPRLHFTYLDPEHLASGARRFDSVTVGDTARPAYSPQVVLISENKDTAIHFPPVPDAIAVEGAGAGGGTAAAFDWIIDAEILLYWGDIDAAGFEILDGFQASGVPAKSMLMDLGTYHRYAPWGTFLQPDGSPIAATTPKALPTLNAAEQAAYLAVCQPENGLPPRIEQERIPLLAARDALLALMDLPSTPPLSL